MIKVIATRRSVRKYNGNPLVGELRAEVEALLAEERVGFFRGRPRFALFDRSPGRDGAKLGTYGMIQGARTFIAGAIAKGPHGEVDYGYALEEIILAVTGLGLGTCWLGGTLSRAEYGGLLSVTDDELIPAVTPVGVPADSRSLVDRIVSWGAKSDSRLPWERIFFDGAPDRPLSRDAAGALEPVLEAMRQGPSASNKQPWRVLRMGDDLHLYLRRTPGYRKLVAATDLQRIDMGIAMCHLETAARSLDLTGAWEIAPPGHVPEDFGEYIVSWRSAS